METMKLSSIENSLLDAKEARAIVGGDRVCSCACRYQESGGSCTAVNASANSASWLHSPGMEPIVWETDDHCA